MTEVEFNEMIVVHGKDILRYCRITAGHIEGDELYQDTLLKLWEQRERLEPAGNIKSYALSVAVRLWKNRKRKIARRRRLAPCSSYEEGVENGDYINLCTDSFINPEEKTMEEELRKDIRVAVHGLPEKYRQVVYLYYSANLKTKEIAVCLKIPESTVKTRLRKAREILKEELEGKIYE